MITRRRVVAGSAGALLLAGAGGFAFAADEAADEPLIALPGKRPLIKRTFRPPNFETPLAELRQQFTANDAFFVRYHLASIPEVDARTWRLRVAGASVKRPLELSLNDLKREFERVSLAAVNQCSGNRRGLFTPRAGGVQWTYGAMGNAMWSGVRLRDVLNRAGINGNALEVVLDGEDQPALPGTPDFAKSIPTERALDEHTLIAFEMNGQPLPRWNGAPARLVVPGWTATYWVKHLTSIRAEPQAFDGFWMKNAYRIPTGKFPGVRFASQENAETTPITEILINSLVTSHSNGDRLARGRPAELAGWAWDGGSGIEAVEISLNEGQSWRAAKLGEEPSSYSWRGFSAALDTSKAGPLHISVRATGRNGARQPESLTPNPAGYHHNIIQTLDLEVA
ncbi:MAG TPA: molybdopterin-dependent oxidoreductase [Steroidobacteraceae bacterium]|jgi:DMSO/TMAO reductase YedYZ molybdopterin-dependent catalytic subunit